MGKLYRVYRLDQETKTKVPIGTIRERRNQSRGSANLLGLAKLAQQTYGETVEDRMRIFLGEELIA